MMLLIFKKLFNIEKLLFKLICNYLSIISNCYT